MLHSTTKFDLSMQLSQILMCTLYAYQGIKCLVRTSIKQNIYLIKCWR